MYMASLVAQLVKNPPVKAEDVDSVPGLGRSPGEGNDNPLQYSSLGNPMDRGAWWAIVRGVAESRTRLRTHHEHEFMRDFSEILPCSSHPKLN